MSDIVQIKSTRELESYTFQRGYVINLYYPQVGRKSRLFYWTHKTKEKAIHQIQNILDVEPTRFLKGGILNHDQENDGSYCFTVRDN